MEKRSGPWNVFAFNSVLSQEDFVPERTKSGIARAVKPNQAPTAA